MTNPSNTSSGAALKTLKLRVKDKHASLLRRMASQVNQVETWLPIAGYEGLYEISNLGRVRSLDRPVGHRWGGVAIKRGQILSPRLDGGGYHFVGLNRAGVTTNAKLHRLVAKHFLPASDLPEVNHKDLDKANNADSNLEWTTRKGNQQHASENGLFTARTNPKRAKKLTPEIVASIVAARESGKTYAAIAKDFSISGSLAHHIVHGTAWAGLNRLAEGAGA